MSTQTHVAVMEVPAAGGEVTYATVSLAAFERETQREHRAHRPRPHPYTGRLRLFWANDVGPSTKITRSAITMFDQLANTLFGASLGARTQAILEHASLGTLPDVRYFELEGEQYVKEVAAGEVAKLTRAWATRARHPHRHTVPGLIFEVERFDRELPMQTLWEQFHRTLTLSLGTAHGHTSAHPGTVLITAPNRTPAEAAAALRDELLARHWPTSVEVGRANGSRSANKAQWAKDKRDAGELLGVWSAAERSYRHPPFQFNAEGVLRPKVKDLLTALAAIPDFASTNDDGGWRKAFWLHGATLALAGPDGAARVPAEVFPTDPDAVIAAVRKDAEVDANASW